MKAVLALGLQLCLVNVILASIVIEPRGPRPIENRDRFKSKQCLEKEWQICSDEDWGPKCPSGCRLQGLMNTENQKSADRINDIRRMLELYSASFGKTHITVNEAVNRIRHTLNGLGGYGNTYNQLVEHLNKRLIILRNRVNDQIVELNLIKSMLIEQFNEVTRLEVDIDMKIRACKGSCKQAFTYNINREQNAQIEKNLRSVTHTRLERIQYERTTRIFKMKPLKEASTDTRYKSAQPLDETQGNYPKFWREITGLTYSLESSTADASVSPTSSVVSDRKGASLTQFSGGKYASQAGSRTSETSTTHFYGIDQPSFNFTKNFGHSSFFETHFKNRSGMAISHPPDFAEFLTGTRIKTGMTKTSVTTLTHTSELQHTKHGGTKSTRFQTTDHRMIDTNNGDSEGDFLIRGEGTDFTSHFGSSFPGIDGASSFHLTHETQPQTLGGFPKGFKSSSGTTPARLSDDETGESDPSADLLHRK
ncbi:uncharacterized protein LOC144493662 [Mustelus asterias]